MKVIIKTLSTGAKMPSKQTPGSIAYDVYTPCDYVVKPGRNILPLDLAMEIEPGYEGKIEPRSGYSAKGMEADLNGYKVRADADVIVGKIDSDYRGNCGVIIKSNEHYEFIIPAGTRIAQLTFYRGETVDFMESDTLSETERGSGGFGHTNK